MTDKPEAGSEKQLDKMTVKDLREVAKEIPEITGVHGMKKDELLDAIKAARGIEDEPAAKPTAKPKKKGKGTKRLANMPVQDLKTMIKDLKAKRQQALVEKDRKMARIYRRRISRIKKRTRQAA
jgi:geranylgeranyl pyrophosphate synthase